MVNSSTNFHFQTDRVFAKTAFNPSKLQTNSHQMQIMQVDPCNQQMGVNMTGTDISCNQFVDQQQFATETSQVSPPDVSKPSPSYMDDDVQFNYPSPDQQYICQPSTVQVERGGFGGEFPDVLLPTHPPKMQRQYSITTVLEVIENHNINDIGSRRVSQPINIHRSQTATVCEPSAPAHHCHHVTAPASDQFASSPAYSNVSNSPVNLPFARYQEGQPNTPAYNVAPTPPTMFPFDQAASFGNHAHPAVAMQATEDLMSPSQIGWNEAAQQQPELITLQKISQPAAISYGEQSVCYELPRHHFKPSQSCPNFDSVQSQFQGFPSVPDTGLQSAALGECSTSYPVEFRPAPEAASNPPTISMNDLSLGSPLASELEEIQSFMKEEGTAILSEQERMDRRRIRNNIACRASRERRKRRKAQDELKAGRLEEENIMLKEQIRRLEMECKTVTEVVRRRMSQS